LSATQQIESLPPEVQIALAHTPSKARAALTIFFELDQRLARIVAATSEPMLGQMRLAWWRDMLAKPTAERPGGDAVLDAIGTHWSGVETYLIKLVDGWEHMLKANLDEMCVCEFADGRAAPFSRFVEPAPANVPPSLPSARCWALADASAGVSEESERTLIYAIAKKIEQPREALPKSLRGLAVLHALSRRSLARGCRPLMEGRGASLVATRAAILGR